MGECLNLRVEMTRKKIKIRQLAECINITEKSLRNKICGKSDFTLSEANKIHHEYFYGLDKSELFAREEEAS